jgi:hypothetical protein
MPVLVVTIKCRENGCDGILLQILAIKVVESGERGSPYPGGALRERIRQAKQILSPRPQFRVIATHRAATGVSHLSYFPDENQAGRQTVPNFVPEKIGDGFL